MIRFFGDHATEDIFHGRQIGRNKRIPKTILPALIRKLDLLNAAYELRDLKVPPGNRLEELKGDLAGFYSIRVNVQSI